MEIAPLAFASVDIFLFITFLGVGVYLSYIYSVWRELTIGIWSLGSYLVAITIALHGLSIFILPENEQLSLDLFKAAMIVTLFSYWSFGVSHIFARRLIGDILLIILLTFPLGFIIPQILLEANLTVVNEIVVESRASSFNNVDFANFFYLSLLFIIFARDSHLIYQASIRENANISRRGVAITHLLAWQFFALSTAGIRYVSRFTQESWYFGLPFVFLLVPLLTLGSRPFDWAREGHEPVLLLLVDQFGNPSFSWVHDYETPLLMQGSTIATINDMLENLVEEPVKSMQVLFKDRSLYTLSTNGYLSILITTGEHKSFPHLLKKIHSILVTDLIRQNEYGVPGYDLPSELNWLLSQLLPDGEILTSADDAGPLKKLLMRSGINLK